MKTIRLNLPGGSYDITVGRGLLGRANEYMRLSRKVFIVTDSGVPREYAERVAAVSGDALIYTVESGEGSKSLAVMERLLQAMLDFGMTRGDCAVAVGGGVVGDLTGFAASAYMRGIDFYNIPTTLLSQVDSSIGGKTAVNLGVVKNIVGAFYQPKAVLIDVDVLRTLSKRHYAAGLAEAVKMSLTSDAELFEAFERDGVCDENLEDIIVRALEIKRRVVEEDEKESGIRKILNFGHTLGHGLEAEGELSGLYHGECVALGMLPVCSSEVRARLLEVLKKLGLPTRFEGDIDRALDFVCHDKKCAGGEVSVIFVEEVGTYKIKTMSLDEFKRLVKERFTV
ncbi:MAG: 3-dehydroquinate synthase [Clostridia bacterium]|nr:3-dehydroquinate synthase [Clostridia bacterium]